MPPELMELYNLYKQELETRSTKENQFVEELDNQIIRVKFIYSEKATKFCEISTVEGQIYGGDLAKFCGLLRIYDLYYCFSFTYE